MWPFGGKRKVVVKAYDSVRAYERDANRMVREGYALDGVVVSKSVGLPGLTHGVLHDRFTVTYRYGPYATT